MAVKNQNDLIVSIVAGVLGLAIIGVAYGTAPKPVEPPAVPPIEVGDAKAPEGSVVYANGLGGSNNQSGGFGAGGAPTGGAAGTPAPPSIGSQSGGGRSPGAPAPSGPAPGGTRPGAPANVPPPPSIGARSG